MGVGLSQGENEFSFALAGGFSSKDEPDLLEKALRMEALHRLVHRLEAECKDFLFKIGYSSIPDLPTDRVVPWTSSTSRMFKNTFVSIP
jgi:hypothetical protein